jgi:hypothetical protein
MKNNRIIKALRRSCTLVAVGSSVLLAGCDGSPHHTVIENGRMTIYRREERKNAALGKWEYWVRDNSTKGWTLITDEEFQVGDNLRLDVSR